MKTRIIQVVVPYIVTRIRGIIMLSLRKILAITLLTIFVCNLLMPNIAYAVLPDFAIVDSQSNSIEVENKTYKTAESSIQTSTAPTFAFQSASQILMEATTGEIIYANNENERLLPASVTKVMTLLLVMEQIDRGELKYTDTVTCSSNASGMGGSQIWFKEGETLTVDEALKCICVVSANDVSYAMAELVGGSHENFVQMMNKKAKELGMENTNFLNAHGIDEEGHYTTAKDIAIMSRELITKHPNITKYTTIWMDSIRGGTFELANTNKLLKTYQGMTGLKTGSTSQALFNLSATAERDGLSLIAVVMKAPTSSIRNEEITTLLNYGFSAYSSKKIATKGETVASVKINKNITKTIDLTLQTDEYLVSKKGENKETKRVIRYNENLKAPITKNAVVGKMQFVDESGNVVRETNLITNQDIEKSSLWDYIVHIMNTYIIRELKTA